MTYSGSLKSHESSEDLKYYEIYIWEKKGIFRVRFFLSLFYWEEEKKMLIAYMYWIYEVILIYEHPFIWNILIFYLEFRKSKQNFDSKILWCEGFLILCKES